MLESNPRLTFQIYPLFAKVGAPKSSDFKIVGISAAYKKLPFRFLRSARGSEKFLHA